MSKRVDKTTQAEALSLASILKGDAGNYGQDLNKWTITASYPSRQCDVCHKVRNVQDFVRSALPYGYIETNRAGCNTCKYKCLANGLSREDFSRMYLGFERVWDVKVDDKSDTGLCAKLWVPKREKKFYAATTAKLWSGHTDERV